MIILLHNLILVLVKKMHEHVDYTQSFAVQNIVSCCIKHKQKK
jgi:hypothetical protein